VEVNNPRGQKQGEKKKTWRKKKREKNMEVVCSRLGLLKIASHAAKYASFAVNGLLIGTINQNVITVKDAIPLFHFNLSLSPFLDFALLTVNSFSFFSFFSFFF